MTVSGATRPAPDDRPVAAPPGKGPADENFPVGSLLLSASVRPHVAAFYAFARAADDIADDPTLAANDKLARLDRFAAAIAGDRPADPALAAAHRMRRSLVETGVPADHCLDLIAAFRCDAVKGRYENWDALMDYCALSANPVGRYLLDLHGERPACRRYADPLCSVLQVLNHIQDCRTDYRGLDRVYLPADWMADAGVSVDMLDADRAGAGLRRVLDRCLDAAETMMTTAHTLPTMLESPRLAMESEVILRIADRLIGSLRRRDPVAGTVRLRSVEMLWCGLQGSLSVLGRRLLAGRWRARNAALDGP